MPLIEKVTQEDLILYEIFKNPVLFGEFVQNVDRLDYTEEFKLDWYQKEILLDFNHYVSVVAGRSVGKTVSLSVLILWLLVYNIFNNDYVIYTVPNKVHLEPVFTNLIRMLRSNSLLKCFIEAKSGINSSDFSIRLLNNSKLICRIAGTSGTGANVIGLHTPIVLLDESGYYPWGTWAELQPILNTWTPGFRLITSGVPTGLRENNILYHTDMENPNFSKHRISALMNPRFSREDGEKYGSEDSEDYIHLVLGQHGKPVFSLFDRNVFQILTYPVYKVELDAVKSEVNLVDIVNKVSFLPGVPEKEAPVIMGVDLGYTEPTAIWIMYLDKSNNIKFHAKIKLTKVSYPIQEKIIDLIDTKYNPIVIGIDKGSAGISVVQNLIEHNDYAHKNYHNKVISIDFSSWQTLGTSKDGEEIKIKTKPFLISVLQDYSNNHRLVYTSTDMEMISELERMTYTKSNTGEITYKTLTVRGGKRGEDHFTSALLCGVGAYYLTNENSFMNKEKKKLYSALMWV